jgi:gliding motility-associated lipoprotein GldD
MKINTRLLLFSLFIAFSACDSEPIPKPRGYFRIDLPSKDYKRYTGPCPFEFDIPRYSAFELAQGKEDSCIFDIVFPQQQARIYFTYLPVENDLSSYVEDAYQMAYSHELKASAIKRNPIAIDSNHVYGMIYDLKGNVASSLQFYATDSNSHFVRGALYFNSKPNADSISPVLEFIRQDVEHMLNSLEWKKN